MTVEWIALTRPGFENELVRESGAKGVIAKGRSGWALIEYQAEPSRKVWRDVHPNSLIFARTLFHVFASLEEVSLDNPDALRETAERAADAAMQWRKQERMAVGFSSLFVETPDTAEGRKLLERVENVGEALEEALRKRDLMPGARRGLPRLHLFLDSPERAWLGVSDPVTGSPWPMGAPKIELPPEAPSRSARKLEEALLLFMNDHERLGRLKPGMRAVDLGAAPGGWSWLLAQRGVRVVAVDNGPMDKHALEYGMVEHVRADGYSFRVERPVDWLVCDVVGAAPRVAKLISNWVSRADMKEAIFNLKLANGDRLRQVKSAVNTIMRHADEAGVRIELTVKHLYHDREEVTAHLRITGVPKAVKAAKAAKQKKAPPPKHDAPPRGRSGARKGQKVVAKREKATLKKGSGKGRPPKARSPGKKR